MSDSRAHNGSERRSQCFHCGASCEDSCVEFDAKLFCCTGCSVVYQLLKTDDVCSVMTDAEIARQRFSRKPIPRFEYVDDESIQASLISFRDAKQAYCVFKVPSIHCASCIWTLENLFRLDPAVLRTEVNFLKKTVSISYVHTEISLRQVVELITRLGYEPEIRLQEVEDREAESRTTKSTRALYYKIGVAGFAFGNVMLFSAPDYLARISNDGALLSPAFRNLFAILSVALSVPVLLYSASDYFVNSWYSLRDRVLSLDVPLALGIGALFVRSVYDVSTGHGTGFFDSFTGLVFFLLIARVFQAKSFDTLSFERNYKSYFPLSVTKKDRGHQRVIPLSKLEEADVIVVRHGELIPADSVLISEHVHVDYSFVSGESNVVELLRGATVYAGGRLAGSSAEMTVTKSVSHSYLTQLWNNSVFSKKKTSRYTQISNAFAHYFTAIVLGVAVVASLLYLPDTGRALEVFTAVLIVACPCALTLAAPFTFGAALTILAKANFYLRSIEVVADLAATDTVVFDKTGTLTGTNGTLVEFGDGELSSSDCLLVLAATKHSVHPLSNAIAQWMYENGHSEQIACADFEETPGKGLHARVGMHTVTVGSHHWLREQGIETPMHSEEGGVQVAIDGTYRGSFRMRLRLREGMDQTLTLMAGSADLYILSGDTDSQRRDFEPFFEHDHLVFRQSPQDKLDFVSSLQEHGRVVTMIGDGMNDAGALRQSNVGIAVSESSTAFTPASDVIVSADTLYRLPEFIKLSRYAVNVLKIAFAVSISYNLFGLTLACADKLSPMFAAVFMPLSSWSVVGIAYGLMRIRERSISKAPQRVARSISTDAESVLR